MKTKDVEVGGTYLTRVSDKLVRVIVVACLPPEVRNGRTCAQMFRLRREGKKECLPKTRSAAALRPCEQPQVIPGIGKAVEDWLKEPIDAQGTAYIPEPEPPMAKSKPPTQCEQLESKGLLPGWGCCQCRVYNGYQRKQCKHCGHTRCCEIPLTIKIQTNSMYGKEPIIGAVSVDSPEALEGLESYLVENQGDTILDEILTDPAPSQEELEGPQGITAIDAKSAYPTDLESRMQKDYQPSNELSPEDLGSFSNNIPPTERNSPTQPVPPTPPTSSIVVSNAEYDAACDKEMGWCIHCLAFVNHTTPCQQCGQSPVYTAEYALDAGYIALDEKT